MSHVQECEALPRRIELIARLELVVPAQTTMESSGLKAQRGRGIPLVVSKLDADLSVVIDVTYSHHICVYLRCGQVLDFCFLLEDSPESLWVVAKNGSVSHDQRT